MSSEQTAPCRLYLITPPRFDPEAFAETLGEALSGGDVACVQLRMVDIDDDGLLCAAAALIPVCRKRDIAFLIADRADIAQAGGADGVHLTHAADIGDARRLLGTNAICGVSACGSRHDAIVAAEAGADYISFGAFKPSQTVSEAAVISSDILTWWNETMLPPCVAVGGIDTSNAAALADAGADFLAVRHAVWGCPGGAGAAVAALNTEIESLTAT